MIRLNQDEMTQEQACNLTQQSSPMREDLKHDKIDKSIVRAHNMKDISNVTSCWGFIFLISQLNDKWIGHEMSGGLGMGVVRVLSSRR